MTETAIAIASERLTVGEYTITRMANGDYWIGREGGEGMGTPHSKFEQLIDDYYLAEF